MAEKAKFAGSSSASLHGRRIIVGTQNCIQDG